MTEINLKNVHTSDMVLVHDMSSECALQMYEVSLKYLCQQFYNIVHTSVTNMAKLQSGYY